jgi:hypothetical protein
MQTLTDLPRALSRPSGLPLYAWVEADGTVKHVQSFEDPGNYPGDEPQPDGRRCLPVYGSEPPGPFDEATQYFDDEYAPDVDRVIRTRIIRDR